MSVIGSLDLMIRIYLYSDLRPANDLVCVPLLPPPSPTSSLHFCPFFKTVGMPTVICMINEKKFLFFFLRRKINHIYSENWHDFFQQRQDLILKVAAEEEEAIFNGA